MFAPLTTAEEKKLLAFDAFRLTEAQQQDALDALTCDFESQAVAKTTSLTESLKEEYLRGMRLERRIFLLADPMRLPS